MKQEKYYLSGKAALKLRGLGHHLKPTVMIGREGITPAVREALEAVLAAHELVKVKVQEGCTLAINEAAEQLAAGTKAGIAQVIGHMILLYRPTPPAKAEQRPVLPSPRPRPGRVGRRGATGPRGGKAAAGPAGKGAARRRQSRAAGRK